MYLVGSAYRSARYMMRDDDDYDDDGDDGDDEG